MYLFTPLQVDHTLQYIYCCNLVLLHKYYVHLLQVDMEIWMHASAVELETKVKQRFAKVSIVSYSRTSLMIIASAYQFRIYLPWGQHLFNIVS